MPHNTGSVTNYFLKGAENTAPLTLTSSISSGATVVPVTGLATNYTDGDVIALVIEPASATNKQVLTGIVSSGQTTLTSVIWTEGTNAAHTGGVTLIDNQTATAQTLMALGILKQHKANGTHSAVTADSVTIAGALSVGGSTSLNGVLGNVAVSGWVRSTPRVTQTASTATLTPNIDTSNIWDVTALAATLAIANPTGTPRDGEVLIFHILDNGTPQNFSITGTNFRNVSGIPVPATTTASKILTIGSQYNATLTKWLVLSISTEA